MRTLFKYILARTYKPLLVQYLSKPRTYHSHGIHILIGPTVFHPGFFHTTHLLLDYMKTCSLAGKRVLELGAGSGLLAMYAAKQRAIVTASDINPTAIHYLLRNSRNNQVKLEIIHSDLFEKLGTARYDYILVNPPFYKKDPQTMEDRAWYCGKEGAYFQNLFKGLGIHMNDECEVVMVLSEGCDLVMIQTIAEDLGFQMDCMKTSRTLIEKNFLYRIKSIL